MNLISQRRPSPAIVVASLALVLAVTGTAIAGPAAISAIGKAKVKKIANVQADSLLRAREATLNVNSARTATSAQTAQSATSAQTADSTLAYAFVGDFGDVTTAKGISSSNVTWMPPGVYCLNLPFKPVGGHATPTSNSSAVFASLSVAGVSPFLKCLASAEVEVVRSELDGDLANGGFYLSLYK